MISQLFPLSFYERDAKLVAKDILGAVIIRKTKDFILSGKIVETEAYYGSEDSGSRASIRVDKISKWLWESPGLTFVYKLYGNWMFNIITDKKGVPGAVFIRAVEPIEGIGIMLNNRKVEKIRDLTSGPGKFTQAFGITGDCAGLLVTNEDSEIIVVQGDKKDFEIGTAHRIGVKKDLEEKLRFYIKGNLFVSRG